MERIRPRSGSLPNHGLETIARLLRRHHLATPGVVGSIGLNQVGAGVAPWQPCVSHASEDLPFRTRPGAVIVAMTGNDCTLRHSCLEQMQSAGRCRRVRIEGVACILDRIPSIQVQHISSVDPSTSNGLKRSTACLLVLVPLHRLRLEDRGWKVVWPADVRLLSLTAAGPRTSVCEASTSIVYTILDVPWRTPGPDRHCTHTHTPGFRVKLRLRASTRT